MFAALSTRNPFYLLLLIAVALVVRQAINNRERTTGHGSPSPSTLQSGALIRLVITVTMFVALFKGLSYHIGQTVLFHLPDWLPVLGGPATLEGLASATIDALQLLAVLAVFTAFSAGADYYALLRSVPAAMHGAGLITSIAITFVPQTIERWAEIREAQSLRGHHVRRVTDLLPLVMPLLAGGMERSMNLAEAMESRGFSRSSAKRALPPLLVQLGLAGGLAITLSGSTMFAFLPGAPLFAWLLTVAGVALLLFTLWAVGAGTRRTHYRRSFWRVQDTPLSLVSLGVLAVLLVFKFLAPSLLSYTPFLRISLPTFDPLTALAICALALPALIIRFQREPLRRNNPHPPPTSSDLNQSASDSHHPPAHDLSLTTRASHPGKILPS
jgi:energy-coupling factor transport system permease protein